jgi:hypothetical protein
MTAVPAPRPGRELLAGAGQVNQRRYDPRGALHAGVDAEDIDQAGQGRDAPHRPARRGEQQVTAGLPGLRPHPAQRTQGTAVDELQRGQVHDDPRVAATEVSASAPGQAPKQADRSPCSKECDRAW